jgi:hypothetical protein
MFRDEEKGNPRIRTPYRPWWFTDPKTLEIDPNMKITALRLEAEKRNIRHENLKKGELVNMIQKMNKLYSLTGMFYFI